MKSMTKRELAGALVEAQLVQTTSLSALNNLAESLSQVFSAIGNLSPEAALSALDQLQESRPRLVEMIEQRSDYVDEGISTLAMSMPDTLEFDEDYDN